MIRTSLSFLVLIACLGLSSCSKGVNATDKGGSVQTGSDVSSSGPKDPRAAETAKNVALNSDSVKIAREDQRRVGITIAPAEVRTVPRILTVAGQVQMDEQHTSHLGTIADGRITSVDVLPGALVKRGTLLGGLHSHMVHETVGALVQAYAAVDRQRAAVAFAQQSQERYNHLYSIEVASLEESQRAEQDLLQAKNQLIDAEATVRMEREHLSELLQVDPESLTPNHLYDREIIPIRSAVNGVVIARNVTVGQVVPTGFEAFVVSDLSTVWVIAAVNERDLSLVHIGAKATVTIQGTPDELFSGRVAMVGDTLDPQTRTVPVRIVVPNPSTRLRPGMFASAQIAGAQTRRAVFIPQGALQDINGMTVVFVTNDGTSFRAQTVTVGTSSEGKTEIVDGLRPGDQVVVGGAFMVKSAMLKGTMGEG
jgi:multidrug efflux pump subunit AcrA (membrane-fusion protein)